MGNLLGVLVALALLTSCSAGGGAISTGVDRWQVYWPEVGVDRYEAVVYPAEAVVMP